MPTVYSTIQKRIRNAISADSFFWLFWSVEEEGYFMWNVHTGYLFHTFVRLALIFLLHTFTNNFHFEFTHLLNFSFNHLQIPPLTISQRQINKITPAQLLKYYQNCNIARFNIHVTEATIKMCNKTASKWSTAVLKRIPGLQILFSGCNKTCLVHTPKMKIRMQNLSLHMNYVAIAVSVKII